MDLKIQSVLLFFMSLGTIEHHVNPGALWTKIRKGYLKVHPWHKEGTHGITVCKESHQQSLTPVHTLLLPSDVMVHPLNLRPA